MRTSCCMPMNGLAALKRFIPGTPSVSDDAVSTEMQPMVSPVDRRDVRGGLPTPPPPVSRPSLHDVLEKEGHTFVPSERRALRASLRRMIPQASVDDLVWLMKQEAHKTCWAENVEGWFTTDTKTVDLRALAANALPADAVLAVLSRVPAQVGRFLVGERLYPAQCKDVALDPALDSTVRQQAAKRLTGRHRFDVAMDTQDSAVLDLVAPKLAPSVLAHCFDSRQPGDACRPVLLRHIHDQELLQNTVLNQALPEAERSAALGNMKDEAFLLQQINESASDAFLSAIERALSSKTIAAQLRRRMPLEPARRDAHGQPVDAWSLPRDIFPASQFSRMVDVLIEGKVGMQLAALIRDFPAEQRYLVAKRLHQAQQYNAAYEVMMSLDTAYHLRDRNA